MRIRIWIARVVVIAALCGACGDDTSPSPSAAAGTTAATAVDATQELGVDTPEGRWVLRREDPTKSDDGLVVLLGHNGEIIESFHMPELPPTWIHNTADFIFGGREGDGCLPDSSIFRIDRHSHEISLVVFPAHDYPPAKLQPGWRLASASETAQYGALVGTDSGTPVLSKVGRLNVNISGIAALFATPAHDAAAAPKNGSC